MFGDFGIRKGHEKDVIMSQKVIAPIEEHSWHYFDNNGQDEYRDSNWNGLSPLNKENQMHYLKVLNRSKADYDSDRCSESESEREPSPKKKRKRNPQVAHNPRKRARVQSNNGVLFTPQYQGADSRGNIAQGNEYSALFTPAFHDRSLIRRNDQSYGLMNFSSGHYSHAEIQLPSPAQIPKKSKVSSWMGPDIPGGEKWGSTESGGFGQMFPSGTPFGQHKSTQRKSHRSQILQNSGNVSDEYLNMFDQAQRSMQNASKKSSRHHNGRLASDSQPIFCLPETIDLTTPDSARSRRTINTNSTIPASGHNRRGPQSDHPDFDDWESKIQDYKSARMQSYIPAHNVQCDLSNTDYPRHRVKNNLSNNESGYPSQYTKHHGRENCLSNSAVPIISSHKNHASSLLVPDDYDLPTELEPQLDVTTEDTYSRRQSTKISPRLCRRTSHKYEDDRGTDNEAVENNSDSDGNETIEEMFRKQRPKKSEAIVKNMENMPLKPAGVLLNNGEEDQSNILSKIRGVDTAAASGLSEISSTGMISNGGAASCSTGMRSISADTAEVSQKEIADQRRQMLASEIIAQRQKEAEKSNDVEALFEEEIIDEARLARIQKAKEVDRKKKHVREEARIIEEGTKATQEKLEAIRKMRAAQEAEERRAQKQQRIEDKRQLDKKNEEERLDAKRRTALEAVRLRRLADEEAQIMALSKIEADRIAAKKHAAALQAFRKAGRDPIVVEDTSQSDDSKWSEKSGDVSDGGMFVPEDDSPLHLVESQEIEIDAENIESNQPGLIQRAVTVTAEANLLNGQNEEGVAVGDSAKITNATEAEANMTNGLSVLQFNIPESTAVFGEADESFLTQLTSPKPVIVSDGVAESSPAQLNTPKPVIAIDGVVELSPKAFDLQKPGTESDRPDQSSNESKPKLEKQVITSVPGEGVASTIVTTTSGARNSVSNSASLSISTIASDGRRRPPEVARPKPTRIRSPDPIRFTGVNRATVQRRRDSESSSIFSQSVGRKKPLRRAVEKSTSQTEAKLQKALKDIENLNAKARAKEVEQKKEWDERMKQLSAMLLPQDLKEINESVQNKTHDTSKSQRISSTTNDCKPPLFTSQIQFISTIESQERDREKIEEARLAKFEKAKATRRKRYDREIRTVLAGQGIDQDEERISKQVDEKMATWEENRRKRERRESGDKDIPRPLSQANSVPQSDAEPDSSSSLTLKATDGRSEDSEGEKDNQRVRAMRAGVKYLASQNKTTSEFSQAASKFRIEEFESDESEEDPDDEPEAPVIQPMLAANSTLEEADIMDGIEVDETLNPAALDVSIIPRLPEIPQLHKTNTAFLPDIVNPKEEDMIHSYSVRHRAGRGNNVFDSVVLSIFHSREEANEYARYKLAEFSLGPSTGKSETHNDDNLYVGQVTTDKDKDHTETVWVTREIVYIGDTANVKRSDIKAIVPAKVFNVFQIMHPGKENDTPIGTIIATVTIRSLANKKAADHFLLMTKPSRPRMDSLAFYNDTVVPTVRETLANAEAEDITADFEGVIPDTEKAFSISISENTVAGPLN